MAKDRNEKFKSLYRLFKNSFENNEVLTYEKIINEIGWSESTYKTYYSKKWKSLIKGDKNAFRVINFNFSEKSFVNMMSQKQDVSSNPEKNVFSLEVEKLLQKAQESAYLAVDIYNRPQTKFRSEGFIVMIIIAWTSLIQAYCEHTGIDYYEHNNETGSVLFKDGKPKSIKFEKLVRLTSFLEIPMQENLIFLSKIRNVIEHHGNQIYDIDLMGEIQACLLNFESIITKTFGIYYSLNVGLAFPLYLLTDNRDTIIKMKKEKESSYYKEFLLYINNYKQALDDSILLDEKYSFKVFLIPKNSNNLNTADLALEFIKKSDLTENELSQLNEKCVYIKEKIVYSSKQGKYLPGAVVSIIQERLGVKFSLTNHTDAWRRYKVRQSGKDKRQCNNKYCIFDETHGKYTYTDEWIDFLISEIENGSFDISKKNNR